MAGKRIIIPFQLQEKILQQLHSNDMGLEKMRIPVCVYWVNINKNIENTVKQLAMYLDY